MAQWFSFSPCMCVQHEPTPIILTTSPLSLPPQYSHAKATNSWSGLYTFPTLLAFPQKVHIYIYFSYSAAAVAKIPRAFLQERVKKKRLASLNVTTRHCASADSKNDKFYNFTCTAQDSASANTCKISILLTLIFSFCMTSSFITRRSWRVEGTTCWLRPLHWKPARDS